MNLDENPDKKEKKVVKEEKINEEKKVVKEEKVTPTETVVEEKVVETVEVKEVKRGAGSALGSVFGFLLKYGIGIAVIGYILYTIFSGTTYSHKNYVNGTLDMLLKGKFNQYMAITDSTKEEANEIYEDEILYYLNAIEENNDITISKETKDLYLNKTKELYKNFKYSVKTKSSSSTTATVTVTYYPLVYKDSYYDTSESILEDYDKNLESLGENAAFDKYIADYANKLLDMKHYEVSKEAVEKDVKLTGKTVGKSSKWTINQDDIYEIYDNMFQEKE